MKTLFLYKHLEMGIPQRIEQIEKYLHTQADERFINLVFGMIKAETEKEAYELPEAHKRILDQRLETHEKNPSAGRGWEEVKASLLGK
ncbi:addiction module protein [Reichenbachiella versicolor]|uniref:addiction module protein n=1 Tax=Reichenbachiella versicolor TaxID=1821036 RepID=UPI000D6DF1C4|nr:addiction module protein [Reichenbachiella versicolor]